MSFGLSLAPQHRVYAAFGVYSFAMGNLFPRIPDIQHAMGVAEGAFGLGLIGTPIGTLISLSLAPPLIEKVGYRKALFVGLMLIATLFAIASHAPSPFVLFFLLIPVGLCLGVVEITVNTEADRVEHQVGFRIMNRAHAFWSFGFFGAGIFGAFMAGSGVSPGVHLALVIPITLLGIVIFLSDFQPAPVRPGTGAEAGPRFALPTFGILVLVSVTLSAMLMEGASIDWSGIYMRDVFDASPFISGFSVAVFAVSQALARFFADRFVDRFGAAPVARVLVVAMAVGCLAVTFGAWATLSLVGFSLMGIGSSALFPLAMSAAAQRPERTAAINVAALAQISFVIFLIGPPLLGYVAEHWGIRASFGLGLPLIVLSYLTAGSLGRKADGI